MFVWGLILAKAKTGYAASSNKNSDQVQGQFKSIIALLFMVAIATFAQTQLEKDISTSAVAPSSNTFDVSFRGRNLGA